MIQQPDNQQQQHFLQQLASVLWETATKPNPTWTDLATIIAAFGIFWATFIAVGIRIIKPRVAGTPWLAQAATQDYHRRAKKIYDKVGCPKTLPEFIELANDLWPWGMLVMAQHFLGGLLCLPSVANLWPDSPELMNTLACSAILSEVGWEIGDVIGWIFTHFCTKRGKKLMPLPMIGLACLHHSLAICVGVPMAMYYRDSRFVHWLCFDLQFGGSIIGILNECLRHLDVSQPRQLFQFQIISFVLLVQVLVTRGFHFVYLCCQVLAFLSMEKNWALLAIAGAMAGLFSISNVLTIIIPTYKMFVKFLQMTPAQSQKKETRRISSTQQHKSKTRKSFLMLENTVGDNNLRLERG